MRYAVVLVGLLLGSICGYLMYWNLSAGPPVVLAAPQTLTVVAAGQKPLLPGGWTNSSHVVLMMKDVPASIAAVDVEVRPAGQAFSGVPTWSGPANLVTNCASSANCRGLLGATLHLSDGSYHLQIRLHGNSGVSPWTPYGGVVSVDTHPPTIQHLASPTDPDPKTVYHTSTMRFEWAGLDTGAGVAGYSYRLDHDPHGEARPEARTMASTVSLTGLDTGTWYFHVRALDHAGNWGPTATFPIRIDVSPPGLAHVRFSQYFFNPQVDSLQVAFSVTRPASMVRVGVYRQSDNSLVRLYTLTHLTRNQHIAVSWNGRDGVGKALPAGRYAIYVRAIDQYGHSSLSGWRDFVLDYRRIVVSLSQQKLVAYDGDRVVLTSLVTTGNKALPTPMGTYHVLGKFHPYTFISPWPKSSPYYYPPSKVVFALLFREGGYFIHDAPWRTAFGPGTNAQLGKPGSNYTGTHGCVNVPPGVAQQLFAWAQVGTVVEVVR